MKRLIYLGLLLAAGSALAQPLEELTAGETINLRLQQTRTFVSGRPITRISVSSKDVAEVIPESDTTINMRGLKPGRTLLTAYDQQGRVVYRVNISVNAAEVGYVKIYGTGDMKGRPTKDFVGYQCTEYGCARGDTDLPVETMLG